MKSCVVLLMSTAVVLLLLTACQQSAEYTIQDNPSAERFAVERLFIVDGCAVYRFTDVSKMVYFVTCPGSVQHTTLKPHGRMTTTEDQLVATAIERAQQNETSR